jgi:hypothetical protein
MVKMAAGGLQGRNGVLGLIGTSAQASIPSPEKRGKCVFGTTCLKHMSEYTSLT